MGTSVFEQVTVVSGGAGANLTVAKGPVARQLSKVLRALEGLVSRTGVTLPGYPAKHRLFTKAGVPATNTEGDSPGGDLCFIIDITGNDVYFISAWSDSTTFVSTKVIEGT